MDLSAAAFWEWTKLFVRDPRMAAGLVKQARLPAEVSVMMIVLAGVVASAASGLHHLALGSPVVALTMPDGQIVQITRSGPIAQGIYAAITGLGLAYAIFAVGRRMGGQGDLRDILGITAVLQLVVTGIVVAQTVAGLALPLIGLGLMLLGIYVFIRGLGHAVNVGHSFDNMGKSVWVTFLSFMALVFVIFIASALLGLGPQPVLVGTEL